MANLARKLLQQLDDDCTVSYAELQGDWFLVADAKTASAHTSNLLMALKTRPAVPAWTSRTS